MRTIHRDIVGPFILSSDGKILLGHSAVYEGMLVVPGGGIESGETALEALCRETLEETGIDITDVDVRQLEGSSTGQSEKVLRDTGERVMVDMRFFDFIVQLAVKADDIDLKLESDYDDAHWYTAQQLQKQSIGPATKRILEKIRFL